jgi:hypothetical protein
MNGSRFFPVLLFAGLIGLAGCSSNSSSPKGVGPPGSGGPGTSDVGGFDMDLCIKLEDGYFATGRQFDEAIRRADAATAAKDYVESVRQQKLADEANQEGKRLMEKIKLLPWDSVPAGKPRAEAEKKVHEMRIADLKSLMTKEKAGSSTSVSFDAAIGRHEKRVQALARVIRK